MSSFFVARGKYFPLFELPSVTTDTRPNSVEGIRTRVRTALINNALARLQPDHIILLGLNPIQSALLAHLPKQRLITIQGASELGPALAQYSHSYDGILRCSLSDLAQGLVRATRFGKGIACDPQASVLPPDRRGNAHGIIVAERSGELSDIIAANYAIAVGADFELIEPFDRGESDRIGRLLVEWGETRSTWARSEIDDAVSNRLAPIDFKNYKYATFFTRGLPYGFVLQNLIPVSHVLFGVNDDLFIFNNILVERSKNLFGSAVVFSPGSFEHEETQNVIQQLQTNNYLVRGLTGPDATPGIAGHLRCTLPLRYSSHLQPRRRKQRISLCRGVSRSVW